MENTIQTILIKSCQTTYGAQTKLLKHAMGENANLFVEKKANYD